MCICGIVNYIFGYTEEQLLISAQATTQASHIQEDDDGDFPDKFSDFRVTDLRKWVIKAVMSDGKAHINIITKYKFTIIIYKSKR